MKKGVNDVCASNKDQGRIQDDFWVWFDLIKLPNLLYAFEKDRPKQTV